MYVVASSVVLFFFQAEDGIRDLTVTGVQTCALPIYRGERVVELVAEHADQTLPRLPLLLAQRAAHIGEDEELMGKAALAERAASQLPAPLRRPSRERDLENAGRVTCQTDRKSVV